MSVKPCIQVAEGCSSEAAGYSAEAPRSVAIFVANVRFRASLTEKFTACLLAVYCFTKTNFLLMLMSLI